MWWRLTLPCPPEMEESLVWKLTDLGLHRHAVQHAPETPDRKTLLVWLPQPEWPEPQRLQAGDQLLPLGLRPLRLREPNQKRFAIRRFRRVLHRVAMQPQIRELPHQRFLQLRRTRECETPPHQRVTG